MVPETLLKKRKSQEEARAIRATELANKKKVSFYLFIFSSTFIGNIVMILQSLR